MKQIKSQSQSETTSAIVVVDQWSFQLQGKEAKEARLDHDHLAGKLGFSDERELHRLAQRHEAHLREFGGLVTVARPYGFKDSMVRERWSYNRQQAMYLIAKSHTPIAADLTVAFIKAFDHLLELVTTQAPTIDLSPAIGELQQKMIEMNNTQVALWQEIKDVRDSSGSASPKHIMELKKSVSALAKLNKRLGIPQNGSGIYDELKRHFGFDAYRDIPAPMIPKIKRELERKTLKLQRKLMKQLDLFPARPTPLVESSELH